MSLETVTPPAAEPLTLAEAKLHLRVDSTDDDSLITDLITAARKSVESRTGRRFITQTLRWRTDRFKDATLFVPLGPVQSVTAVRTYNADGVSSVYASSNYIVDGAAHPPRIVRKSGSVWPTVGQAANGVEVEFVAGFGDAAADAPEDLIQAVRLLTAHYYENREAVEDRNFRPVPESVATLLAPYVEVRL